MSQRTERLEQFAIDVILERRHGLRAALLRGSDDIRSWNASRSAARPALQRIGITAETCR